MGDAGAFGALFSPGGRWWCFCCFIQFSIPFLPSRGTLVPKRFTVPWTPEMDADIALPARLQSRIRIASFVKGDVGAGRVQGTIVVSLVYRRPTKFLCPGNFFCWPPLFVIVNLEYVLSHPLTDDILLINVFLRFHRNFLFYRSLKSIQSFVLHQ